MGAFEYRQAEERRRHVEVEGFFVCHPDDIIASKQASGRAKDLESLPRLRSFREYWLQKHGRQHTVHAHSALSAAGAQCYASPMAKSLRQPGSGPFRADQIRSGDPYELSNGHRISCLPTGRRGGKAASVGDGVLSSDPALQDVGVEVGFSPSPEILRAPDLSVGEIPDLPGWAHGAPPLAVEYADTGQDEADLRIKIRELFAAGTRHLWVVRLTGPRRVEVHQPDREMRLAHPGEQLEAPGILANPVPVEALYDRKAARRVIFRNLLQSEGYVSLDDVRAEGEARGREEGEIRGRAEGEAQGLRRAIAAVCVGRGLAADDGLQAALASCNDPAVLEAALRAAATATSPAEILAALRA